MHTLPPCTTRVNDGLHRRAVDLLPIVDFDSCPNAVARAGLSLRTTEASSSGARRTVRADDREADRDKGHNAPQQHSAQRQKAEETGPIQDQRGGCEA